MMKLLHLFFLKPQKSYWLGLLLLLSTLPVLAQDQVPILADSVHAIPDTLLFKIQKAQAAITEINAANKKEYGVNRIQEGIEQAETTINPIKADLTTSGSTLHAKDLQSYSLILKDAQTKLTAWQNSLSKASNDLQKRANQVIGLSKDSLLNVTETDVAEKQLYTAQLTELKIRLQRSGERTTAKLDTISRLLANVSALSLTVTDLQNQVQEQLRTSGENVYSKESPYLWEAPNRVDRTNVERIVSSSYQGQKKILSYFLNSAWDNRVLLLLTAAAFFIWVYSNFKKARKLELRQKLGDLKFQHITPVPILATFIVLFNLPPLFEPDSPSLYIELTQFFLLVCLTISLRSIVKGEDRKHWLMLVGLYMTLIIVNTLLNDSLYLRLGLLALNGTFLYLGMLIYRKLKQTPVKERLIKPVVILYLVLNVLAILLNIFGRVSLAKVYSMTAVIGLIQMVGLDVFIQILSDALELQIKLSACSEGIFSRVSIPRSRAAFRRAMTVVAIILWVLVFFINLGVAGGVFALLQQILTKTRTFGSVTFTLGNILLFGVIVYVANLLQKHIGVLFGESSVTFDNKTERKSSKLVLIRLVILILGVLMAITASGIPMDRLTVVLGALSVGIGLGMQNIVNNFVSGIILIFEKPFQIGDYVELADKKGKVQDIGIRSSKMLTPQGSVVVIPNGDLLSGRLVNWTLSNSYLKTELTFKVNADADLDKVTKIVETEIGKLNDSLKNIPPEVLVNAIAADSIELKILAWVTNIYVEANFKSQLLTRLMVRFKEAEIKVM
ncbi:MULTISPECIES: mechanosensitive ion channel domain-containing protein [unclassified Siphonobacter]|uniref:mechanosensitive ion channel domain-containing protein n=1 Tax=unclassified Siphonobacter TaxID=2635712 RepID=UPI001E59A436|nr:MULTISPECIES: mechanosensitive ion channel domain-containing protein [unclassified Siphonobacter]